MIIDNKGKFIRHIGGVMLVPGINQLTDTEVKKFEARLASNKIDKSLLDSGELVKVKAGSKKVKDITDMNIKDAAALIKATASIDTLTAWKATEMRGQSRDGMIKAIDERVEALTKAEKTETDE